jgi:hypothetical protein
VDARNDFFKRRSAKLCLTEQGESRHGFRGGREP